MLRQLQLSALVESSFESRGHEHAHHLHLIPFSFLSENAEALENEPQKQRQSISHVLSHVTFDHGADLLFSFITLGGR